MIYCTTLNESSYLTLSPGNEYITKLLNKLLSLLSEVGKYPHYMYNYFNLILCLIKHNNKIGFWMNANKYGPKLIHFMLQR